uniref:Uncharacterized protein n=1 Tax=Fagus sylvatica TaxID=28930 RepID=A0A2N9FSP6_FAGSY
MRVQNKENVEKEIWVEAKIKFGNMLRNEMVVSNSNEEHNAEIVLSVVVVDELVDKLRSFATKHIISKWGFMEELIKLLLSLTKIQVVLHDAEKMQVSDESVMIWLSELRDVAYDVDDMLDEFHSKILRTKTLRIKNCNLLEELPKDLSNLINLRHIYIDLEFINRTPKDIGRLTSLQTLPFFTVNPDAGCSLEELGHLNQLSGELDIYNLEHVRDNVEAKSANLAKNAKIYKLGFHWRVHEDFFNISDEVDDINDEEVLEGLQPHQNLKSLTIEGYKGKKFPSWMLTGRDARDGLSLFDNLIEITLSFYYNCEEVPTLGHLPCLQVLEINEMNNVRCIGTKFYSDGNYRNALFPTLRRLKLSYMINLVEWKDAKELTTATYLRGFSSLIELEISKCTTLTTFPSIEGAASLRKLVISLRGVEVLSIGLKSCTSLQILRIEECPNLKRISEGLPESLKTLKIGPFCEMLEAFPSLISSTSIQHSVEDLYLNGWAKLNSLPDQFQRFTALKVLSISNFDEMEALPEWLGNLSSLQKLSLLRILLVGDLDGVWQLTSLLDVYGLGSSSTPSQFPCIGYNDLCEGECRPPLVPDNPGTFLYQ